MLLHNDFWIVFGKLNKQTTWTDYRYQASRAIILLIFYKQRTDYSLRWSSLIYVFFASAAGCSRLPSLFRISAWLLKQLFIPVSCLFYKIDSMLTLQHYYGFSHICPVGRRNLLLGAVCLTASRQVQFSARIPTGSHGVHCLHWRCYRSLFSVFTVYAVWPTFVCWRQGSSCPFTPSQ